MKKTVTRIAALMLAVISVFAFAGCSILGDTEDVTVDSTPVIDADIPVTKAEIITYFNDVMNYVRNDANFDNNAPTVAVSESFGVDGIKIIDPATGDTTDTLKPLQQASKQIKNLILANLPTDEMVPDSMTEEDYGKGGIKELVYPLGADKIEITPDDVILADCKQEVTTYYVDIFVKSDSVAKFYETPDKAAILKETEKAQNYAKITDYSAAYIDRDNRSTFNEENPDEVPCCQIRLTADAVTNKIISVEFTKWAYVYAPAVGAGSFESCGNFDITFRFNDTTKFDFNWTAPVADVEE